MGKSWSPRASALRGDVDYRQLLAHLRADPEFRELVHDFAPMLGLRVVDVLEHAIVLAPFGPDSVFAATLTDLRPGLGEMSRGALALVHVVIAATFFPTAVALTGAQDDFAEVSATPARIAAISVTCLRSSSWKLRAALHIVRRMVRDGRIPDHVPRFGGQPVFRIGADLSRIGGTQRREILRSYITDLVEDDRVPERGQDIAAEMVERMTAALGRSTLDIRLLKPKGEGDTEHMPPARWGELRAEGLRIPQESFGLEQLRGEAVTIAGPDSA